jgi:LacI family transcriptional regulator
MPRPTIQSIARKTGFSGATVSLALRGHPRIPESTREKIREAAREMGYSPNPSISQLMTHIRAAKNPEAMTTLAVLNANRVSDIAKLSQYHKILMQGMQEQAMALGYRLETFWLREKNMTQRRMSQILESRGVQGIVIPPIEDFGTILGLNWEKFSVTTVGYSLLEPRFNRVVGNQRQGIFTAIQKLLQTGHKRIGAVWNENFDSRMTFIPSSVLHWFHSLLPAEGRIPFLYVQKIDYKALKAWIKEYKPDAIVTHLSYLDQHLREAGFKVPEEFSVVVEGSQSGETDTSGCYVSPYDIGQRLVKQLDSQLLQHDFGIPKVPVTILMEMQWNEGCSIRKRGPANPLVKVFDQTAW